MKVIKIITIIILVIIFAYFVYSNIPFFPPSSKVNEGKTLTSTHWMGSGNYAKFAPGPESNTLGCWSITFAQISYYHRLQPTGISDYKSSKGYKVHEELSAYVFNWNRFENKITDTTLQDNIDEISRYAFYISTIVQKDFGIGRYMTMMPPINNIEEQLNVNAQLYLNYKGLFQSRRKIKNIVMREIEANRPLYLYYRNMNVKGSGHSVVLDGYRFDNKNFKVHLNFGWGGRKDGWYDLFDSIAIAGDTELRMLITVQPLSNS